MGYFRCPRTANEKRQWYKIETEEEESGEHIRVRGRRSAKFLVDAYDDFHKSYGWRRRSWKAYKRRSKQWDRSDIGC